MLSEPSEVFYHFYVTSRQVSLRTNSLGQLCAALWDSQARPVVIQPGIEPGSVVTSLALRCSALDRCATREPSQGDVD